MATVNAQVDSDTVSRVLFYIDGQGVSQAVAEDLPRTFTLYPRLVRNQSSETLVTSVADGIGAVPPLIRYDSALNSTELQAGGDWGNQSYPQSISFVPGQTRATGYMDMGTIFAGEGSGYLTTSDGIVIVIQDDDSAARLEWLVVPGAYAGDLTITGGETDLDQAYFNTKYAEQQAFLDTWFGDVYAELDTGFETIADLLETGEFSVADYLSGISSTMTGIATLVGIQTTAIYATQSSVDLARQTLEDIDASVNALLSTEVTDAQPVDYESVPLPNSTVFLDAYDEVADDPIIDPPDVPTFTTTPDGGISFQMNDILGNSLSPLGFDGFQGGLNLAVDPSIFAVIKPTTDALILAFIGLWGMTRIWREFEVR